jgi:hypothetical protein
MMLCHKASKIPIDERTEKAPICQGWVRVLGTDAIGVRRALTFERVTMEEIEDRDGPLLFSSFAAMLRANKIPLPPRNVFDWKAARKKR